MWTKNLWQPLLCIIIQVFQVSSAGVTYYPVPKFFEVLVPMKMREPQNAPHLIPAPAENIAQMLPADAEKAAADTADDLVKSLNLPPEIVPPNLNSNLTIPKFLTDIIKDPGKGLAALADDLSSLLRDKLPGSAFSAMQSNPLDFTALIDSIRKALDTMGQNKECENGLTVIDHSLYTSKELISAVNALHKLREMWRNVNVNALVQCFVSPSILPPPINLSPPSNDNA